MSAVRGPPKLRQHRHMQANCKCFAATSTLLTVMDAAVDTDHAGSAVWWAPARAVALIRVNAPIRQILTCKQPGPAPPNVVTTNTTLRVREPRPGAREPTTSACAPPVTMVSGPAGGKCWPMGRCQTNVQTVALSTEGNVVHASNTLDTHHLNHASEVVQIDPVAGPFVYPGLAQCSVQKPRRSAAEEHGRGRDGGLEEGSNDVDETGDTTRRCNESVWPPHAGR